MKSTEEIIGLLSRGYDFESFLSTHINGLLAVRKDGLILSADQGFARLFGYEEEALPGLYLSEVLPLLELSEAAGVEQAQGSTLGRKQDGQSIHLSYTLRQAWKNDGPAYFLLVHCKSSIAQSLELYAHMFEWIPVGILIYNLPQQRPLKCNQELARLFEAENEQALLNDGPFSNHPGTPADLGQLQAHIQSLSRQERQQFELRLHTLKGGEKHFEITTALIPALNEHLMVLLFKDISEHKAAEEKLRESWHTLEAVINTAVDGIIIIDDKGGMILANEAASRLFGYSREELLGQNVNMLMPAPHHRKHDSYIQNYHQTGIGKIIGIGREVDGRRKDGSLFPFKLGVSRVESQGRVLFSGVIHDLTGQKKAEEKILALNRELEQKVEERTEKLTEVVNKLLQSNLKLEREIKERKAAVEALRHNEEELRKSLNREKELSELKSRFVSMASHEFRTPLTTIASSSELIGLYTESGQQDKRSKHLRRIRSAVTNLTGILGDFLSLSKLEEGKIRLEPVTFLLLDLAEEIVDDIQGLLKNGQKINTNFEKLGQEVVLDKKMLKNVFINLLSNAIKYSPEGASIHFSVQLQDSQLLASIRDEGIGIPEEDQRHLFTRFFRAANAINIQGTGLGLNIVKRYLDILGGEIRFESAEGKGTTFFVELPLQQA
ncbi:MAG: PAS domain S-box protein [Lewinellaceae bacterium]|nr:PAS domain S-box protein [Lewinellaceae bacterium]